MSFLKRLVRRYGLVMAADIVGLWFVRLLDLLVSVGRADRAVELKRVMCEYLERIEDKKVDVSVDE